MTIWFTSDEHFGHARIIQYSGRPFATVDEMNEEMVRRHNAVVRDGDTVIHVGDFSLDEKLVPKYLPRLAGEHMLIVGNHDACHPSRSKWVAARERYREYGFNSVHVPMRSGGDRIEQFLAVTGRVVLVEQPGVVARLTHMPHSDAEDPRHSQWRPSANGLPLVHGHVHERWKIRGQCLNVGVDQWDFTPVSLETVLTQIAAMLAQVP